MKIQDFLQHHGIRRNPFAEEDAQTDPVFKKMCITETFHPAWDKVYGDPREPTTAIVFGTKGSGKTALRLQIAEHLATFNQEHPEERVFVICYDDFNPFLDRFRISQQFHDGNPIELLQRWRLWDHMDAILSLGVTQLIDSVSDEKSDVDDLTRRKLAELPAHVARDLLLLQTCYDQSSAEPELNRWHRLRKQLHYWNWHAYLPVVCGVSGSILIIGMAIWLAARGQWSWLASYWWLWLVALLAVWSWYGFLFLKRTWQAYQIKKRCRSLNLAIGMLRHRLLRFPSRELSNQPLLTKHSTDDRYALLTRFQTVLRHLGFRGIIVLVDRVDEPELINGDPQRMRSLVWPMFDNKFLKHPGMGIKMLLPIELKRFADQEDAAFHERARLDKQNVIAPFEWTAESLLDMANARIAACAEGGQTVSLFSLLSEEIGRDRVMQALRELRVPRHMFKFFYRLFAAHCNAHSDEKPVWRITPATFEATLAVYLYEEIGYS